MDHLSSPSKLGYRNSLRFSPDGGFEDTDATFLPSILSLPRFAEIPQFPGASLYGVSYGQLQALSSSGDLLATLEDDNWI